MVLAIVARAIVPDPTVHDRAVAGVSHLPYAAAVAFVNCANRGLRPRGLVTGLLGLPRHDPSGRQRRGDDAGHLVDQPGSCGRLAAAIREPGGCAAHRPHDKRRSRSAEVAGRRGAEFACVG